MAELAPHHTIGRRAILLATTGAATVAAGCSSRGEGPAMRSPRAVTSQPAVEVLSSDALVSKDGDHANLAALNTTAGLATGPTLDDPYGPFVQTALPKNHALLDSKPSETDARLYASESPDLWRARMRALAPGFVNTVVDGPELWFHDRTAIEAVVQQVFDADSRRRGEAPGQVTTDLFGEPSFANTDGRLAKRLGASPLARKMPTVRTGVARLAWAVTPDDGMRGLVLHARTVSAVMVGKVRYDWWRTINLDFQWDANGENRCQFPYSDVVRTKLKAPLKALPVLRLTARTPDGWRSEKVGGLGLRVPADFARQKPHEGTVTFKASARRYLEVFTDRAIQTPGWSAVAGLTNTQFRLPTGQVVFAEWGPGQDDDPYFCKCWVYGKKQCYVVGFTTTARDVVDDLRHHAAGWSLNE